MTAHTRRAALGGALVSFTAAASAVGITAGAAASVADCAEAAAERTPIAAAAVRISQLCAFEEEKLTSEEFDAITAEQCKLSDFITDSPPRSVGDAVVLLMVASSEIAANNLHNDGTFGFEHGDIIVRRVMHFLAGQAGLAVQDFGGMFFLPSEEHEAVALEGTIEAAALRFNHVDQARAWNRRDEYRHLMERQIIRARHGLTSPFEGRS